MAENIEKIRHSLAHIMASAILELYPKTKLGMGPAIENGFYYDIDFGEEKISDTDLKKGCKYIAEDTGRYRIRRLRAWRMICRKDRILKRR